jgi:hypothetical protein
MTCAAIECNGKDRVQPGLRFCFSHWNKIHPVLQAAIWNRPGIGDRAASVIEAMAAASLAALEGKFTNEQMHVHVRESRDKAGKLFGEDQQLLKQVAADLTAATMPQWRRP